MRINSIKYNNSHVDGPGIRTVLFMQGCDIHCKGCQNPITWDEKGGLPFDAKAEDELFDALKQPFIDGITFSSDFAVIISSKVSFPQSQKSGFISYSLPHSQHLNIIIF